MISQPPPVSSHGYDDLAYFPYGVGHGDEGVCLLVRMGPYRILLDCGMAEISSLKNEGIPPADLVLCSHAHPDHARGLLALHESFPQLPVYASELTTQLLPLNWPEIDPQNLPQLCQALPMRSPVEFKEGLSAELFPAGHLPGASAILLTYTNRHRSYTVLYTGDFFLSNSRLVEGLPLEALRGLEPDVLIVEGSYGTARHPHRRNQENQLAERINQAIAQANSVLMPVPTLGLGQELLMLLRSHHLFTGRNLDIWVDGNVAAGCDAYLEILTNLPASVQNFARHQSLFWDERVRPRVRRLLPEQRPSVGQSPCIILTEENHDLREYCQPGTGPWVLLLPQQPRFSQEPSYSSLTIQNYLLAQHSDGLGTTQLIHNIRPQHVIFVHASPTYLADLTGLEELHNRYHLHSPPAGTLVELPIGETFVQPAAPETSYEGELTELGTVATITLPEAIAADPRWQHFADTGLVEARWQGEELVLRGLSQRELLSQSSDTRVPMNVECCGNCLHQRGQRCWNQDSPLYEFKVTPEGYCPVFEPAQPPSTPSDADVESLED
ncbi:MBL fold metallo-hydrolase [Coleofasciculus sp. FACHB-1120]|uniref:MBL fold metallo-hydrolase n=1 Tax=Coleofasciculus sp. FACHB-1120 TaxID=2692783 RepID=UPI001687B063|nr:MBL fold metallo-hydrolase [Coleofasciculus sp. FACHB-1120]MBD2742738.1 MBL fold metallo-hydrolase [Coleofasciculus sp. FACHB-1120]